MGLGFVGIGLVAGVFAAALATAAGAGWWLAFCAYALGGAAGTAAAAGAWLCAIRSGQRGDGRHGRHGRRLPAGVTRRSRA